MMDNQNLSDLIGLIYDVAHDVTVWPQLLEFLSEKMEPLLAETRQIGSIHVADTASVVNKGSTVALSGRSRPDRMSRRPVSEFIVTENALDKLLQSHCERALTLNRRMNEAIEERNAMEELLHRLPLGMMIVDAEGRVLTYNSRIERIMSESNGISIANGELNAPSSTDTIKLRQMITSVANGKDRESKAINLSNPDAITPISVLLFPFQADTNSVVNNLKRVVVLVASPEVYLEIPKEPLMAIYNLTAAEARLVSLLIRDKNLDSIAEQFGISIHTIRSQLKSVYEKTGTHRQAELVRQVISGPAMLAAISRQTEDSANPSSTPANLPHAKESESKLNQTMRLPDNRVLGYAEYGVPNGRPVILMHAVIGSRLQRHPDESIVEKHGVRLIVPDRPGAGLSDRKENMTLLDWADDVECLADHLGIKDFSVIGFSGGSAFAMACAYQLRSRIKRLVLVSAIAPFNSVWEFGDTSTPYRLLWVLSRYTPSLLGMLMRLGRIAPKSEQQKFESYRDMKKPAIYGIQPVDGIILKRIDEDTRESCRQGDFHILHEFILYANDWGFELSAIQASVQLWVGELDGMVPEMINRLIREIPHCQRQDLPGEGHYLLYNIWEDVIKNA